MGNRHAVLPPEKLNQYQDCTFFSRSEIIKLYRRFRQLSPETVPAFMPNDCIQNIFLPPQLLLLMPELKDNPFVERILRVFSDDGSGCMNFENFLDMFNVFSDQAPVDLKALYAYKIFDIDQDKSLNTNDIKWSLKTLTRNELTEEERCLVVTKVLEETEMDDDCEISYMEFEHVVTRSPDFLNTFRLRV